MKCLYYDFPNAGVKTVVFAQIIRAIILRRKLDLNTKNKLVDEELGFLNIIKEESSLFNTQKLFLYYYLFLFTIKQHSKYYAISRHTTIHVILYKRILTYLPANLVSDAVYAPVTAEIPIHES